MRSGWLPRSGDPVAERAVATRVAKTRPTTMGTPRRRPAAGAATTRTAGLRVRTAPTIIVLVGVLCIFGLIMVGSASPIISLQLYGSPWTILIRQALWMGVGGCVLFLGAKIDYRRWRKFRAPLMVVSMGLLVIVLVPHIGVSAGGSSRWIGLGMLQLQPSELMKLALVVFAADLLTRRADCSSDPKKVIVPVLAVLVVAVVLILKQPDMGTALVLCCIAFGVLFMGGVPMVPILKVIGLFAGMAVVVGLADPYRRDRILSFLNPGANKSGTGYQVWQSLIGLGSGHIFGLGLGGGRGNGAPSPTPIPTSSSRWWARSSAWSAPSCCSPCSSP